MEATKGKVLVIEDEAIWQRTLQHYLESAGFYVVVVDNLNDALSKIQKELFHFITIDMNLIKSNFHAELFEGWNVLEIVKKFGILDRTPTMVISAFIAQFEMFKREKNLDSLFFMSKQEFRRNEFIEIVEREVARRDLRFYDDKRI